MPDSQVRCLESPPNYEDAPLWARLAMGAGAGRADPRSDLAGLYGVRFPDPAVSRRAVDLAGAEGGPWPRMVRGEGKVKDEGFATWIGGTCGREAPPGRGAAFGIAVSIGGMAGGF
jgi:hypothetical protein